MNYPITAEMRQQQYITELEDAQEILQSLRQAYKEHAAGRALTRRYKIKDREMEFTGLADLLKQIGFWQQEIRRLETAAGLVPARPRRMISRF